MVKLIIALSYKTLFGYTYLSVWKLLDLVFNSDFSKIYFCLSEAIIVRLTYLTFWHQGRKYSVLWLGIFLYIS